MTKTEFIEKLTKEINFPAIDTRELVNFVINSIIEVANEERLVISGFGTFDRRNKMAKVGTNPQTGERLIVPAYSSLHFTPSRVLKREPQST